MVNYLVENVECNQSSGFPGPEHMWNIYIYISEEDKTYTSPFFYALQKATQTFEYKNLNVFVLHRAANFYGSYKLVIKGGIKSPVIIMNRIEEDIDMMDPDTLLTFVKENREKCPANHHALFLQCHSNGWFAMQSQKDKRKKPYPELIKGLVDAPFTFDLIGLNSCYISTLETAFEFRKLTRYLIANEMASPLFPMWGTTFFYAFSQSQDPVYIAKQICADFITMNNNLPKEIIEKKFQIETDISLLDLSHIEELVNCVVKIDLSRIDKQTYLDSRVNPDKFMDKEYGHFYLVHDLYTAVRGVVKNLSPFEEIFYKVVILYMQTKKLMEHKWSEKLHGLGYVPCPYKNNEYGFTYRSLEIYKNWDKLLNCDYTL